MDRFTQKTLDALFILSIFVVPFLTYNSKEVQYFQYAVFAMALVSHLLFFLDTRQAKSSGRVFIVKVKSLFREWVWKILAALVTIVGILGVVVVFFILTPEYFTPSILNEATPFGLRTSMSVQESVFFVLIVGIYLFISLANAKSIIFRFGETNLKVYRYGETLHNIDFEQYNHEIKISDDFILIEQKETNSIYNIGGLKISDKKQNEFSEWINKSIDE